MDVDNQQPDPINEPVEHAADTMAAPMNVEHKAAMRLKPVEEDATPVENPMPAVRHAEHRTMSIISIIAVILSVLAIILAVIQRTAGIAPAVGCVGLVVGILGVISTFYNHRIGKTIAILSVIFSLAGIILSFALPRNIEPPVEQTPVTTGEQTDQTLNYGLQDLEGSTATSYIRINQPVRSTPDVNGANTILITYDWNNAAGNPTNLASALNINVTQNGQPLNQATYAQTPESYDPTQQTANVDAGQQATITIAYTLIDDSPITVTITDPSPTDGGSTIEHTFDTF